VNPGVLVIRWEPTQGAKMSGIVELAIEHWIHVAPVLKRPESEEEYNFLVESVKELRGMAGADESHPLMGLVEMIGRHLDAYRQLHRSS
jgi:HTH-type transcriptional regulator/antitoxin HigA